MTTPNRELELAVQGYKKLIKRLDDTQYVNSIRVDVLKTWLAETESRAAAVALEQAAQHIFLSNGIYKGVNHQYHGDCACGWLPNRFSDDAPIWEEQWQDHIRALSPDPHLIERERLEAQAVGLTVADEMAANRGYHTFARELGRKASDLRERASKLGGLSGNRAV